MTITPINVPEDSEVFGATTAGFARFEYSPAVRANGLLFIAGQVGYRPDGSLPDTIEEQTEWALRRTEAILGLDGLTLSALVDVVSYHTDMQRNLPGFLDTKKRFIGEPLPAWTMVGITALARPEFLIEIRAVAAHRF